MYNFARWYFPDRNCQIETLIQSCGAADLIASAYGGRNYRCAVEFIKSGKDFSKLEAEMLNGQKLQGTLAAAELFALLKMKGGVKKFPLLSTIHLIATKSIPAVSIIDYDGAHLDEFD
jgi:glycerol-3-phosphate dehydrogenase (NAD+)